MSNRNAGHPEYPGQSFSEGDKVCSDRKIFELKTGAWTATGRRCSDSRPVPLSEAERNASSQELPPRYAVHPKYPKLAYHNGATVCIDGRIFTVDNGVFVLTDRRCHGTASALRSDSSADDEHHAPCVNPVNGQTYPDGAIVLINGVLYICRNGFWKRYNPDDGE